MLPQQKCLLFSRVVSSLKILHAVIYQLFLTNTNNLDMTKISKLDEPDMLDTAGEVRTNSLAMFSYGRLHTDEKELDNLLELRYKSSVLILDVAWKTS